MNAVCVSDRVSDFVADAAPARPSAARRPCGPFAGWLLEVEPPTEPARREWRLIHPADRNLVLYLYRLRVAGKKVRQVGCTRAVCLALGWPSPPAKPEDAPPLTWEQRAALDAQEEESSRLIEEAFRAALNT